MALLTLVVVLTDGQNGDVRACPLPLVPVVATLALPLVGGSCAITQYTCSAG
jgi:hypothetical protein